MFTENTILVLCRKRSYEWIIIIVLLLVLEIVFVLRKNEILFEHATSYFKLN